METAAPAGSGKMVAVMNTDPSLIEEICQQASEKGVVTPANYNTPAQIVIGGEVAAVVRYGSLGTARYARTGLPGLASLPRPSEAR